MGYPELPPYYSLNTEISTGTGGSGRGTVAVTGRISARVCATALRLVENRLTEKSNQLYGAEGIFCPAITAEKNAAVLRAVQRQSSAQRQKRHLNICLSLFCVLCTMYHTKGIQPVFLRAIRVFMPRCICCTQTVKPTSCKRSIIHSTDKRTLR